MRTAESSGATNIYQVPRVILSPISDEIQTDENLEPPFVRKRAANSSFVYIDTYNSRDKLTALNTGSFIVGSSTDVFVRRIKRFSIVSVRMSNAIPNINPRNNVVSFQSSNTGNTIHTVTIPEGFYTAATATSALVTALNSVSGATGLTFTAPLVYPGFDQYIALTAAGGTFRFVDSQFTRRGWAFWGFDNTPRANLVGANAPFSNIFYMGSITAKYSEYFDVVSFALNQYTKNPNSGNDLPGNELIRIFLGTTTPGNDIGFNVPNPAWINFSTNTSLRNIDLQILDQFDEPIYLPLPQCNNFRITLVLLAEL